MKIERKEKETGFTPFEIVVKVETKEERVCLIAIFGLDVTISDSVRYDLRNMARDFVHDFKDKVLN